MSLLPPDQTPLKLQSHYIRRVLREDSSQNRTPLPSSFFAKILGDSSNRLLKNKAFCQRGHCVVAQRGPARLCCSNCRSRLGFMSYLCAGCDRSWFCEACVKFVEHPLRRATRERGSPTKMSTDGKLRYAKQPTSERQAIFREEASASRKHLDQRFQATYGSMPDAILWKLPPSHEALEKSKPRKFYGSTPRSFFRAIKTTEEAKQLGLPPSLPLEARRVDIKKGALALQEPVEDILTRRQDLHDDLLESFLRRTGQYNDDDSSSFMSMESLG